MSVSHLRDKENYPSVASLTLLVSLQPQAHPAPNAQIEPIATGQAQKMAYDQQRSPLSSLSEPGQGLDRGCSRTGVGLGYHIHSSGRRICVLGHRDGCLQACHSWLASLEIARPGADI